jgi:hypothetical protein
MRTAATAATMLLLACGDLNRSAAEQLIKDKYFPEGSGVTVAIPVSPAATRRVTGLITQGNAQLGDCRRSLVGWLDPSKQLSCLHTLYELGAVKSCGIGWYNASEVDIERVTTFEHSCGNEQFGTDVYWEFSQRSQANQEPELSPVFVATFSATVFDQRRCELFLERSIEEFSASKSEGRDQKDVLLDLFFAGVSQLDAVTGIAEEGEGSRSADFTWHVSSAVPLSRLNKPCRLREGNQLSNEPRHGRAAFRKYDDGWRIEKMTWID